MIGVVTVAEMLRLEAEVDVPEFSLMRTAAFGLYVELLDILRENFDSIQGTTVVGLVGPGNNGSDALWAMSLLSARGVKAIAIDTTQKRSRGFADELFASNFGQWGIFEDITSEVDLILDGIAGLRNLYPPADDVLEFLLSHPEACVVAVDMPSCFDNDAALPIDSNRVINADYTITFGNLKPCHVFDPARSLCGEVRLVNLPIASPESRVATLVLPSDITMLLQELEIDANKYSHGVLGVIAGSSMYAGAGALTLLGSQWGGSGYIQYVGPDHGEIPANVVRVNSVEQFHEKINTVVIGPGVGIDTNSKATLEALLEGSKTLLLDADAITMLSNDTTLASKLEKRSALTILTPHHGEASRLALSLGIDVSKSVHVWVSEVAQRLNVLVSYKGAHGFVALPDGSYMVCDTTSSALATAGTGDVLSGLMGSLIARQEPQVQHELAHAAIGAVMIHSLAAELALDKGLHPTAVDIAYHVRSAMALLRESHE